MRWEWEGGSVAADDEPDVGEALSPAPGVALSPRGPDDEPGGEPDETTRAGSARA
jgi:hypothetical protein